MTADLIGWAQTLLPVAVIFGVLAISALGVRLVWGWIRGREG